MSKQTCIESNCDNNALYNYKNEKGYKYCNDHKQTRIVNGEVELMYNKSRKLCIHDKCYKIAKYDENNNEGYGRKYCKDHTLIELINLTNNINLNETIGSNKSKTSNKICIIDNCNVTANFNYKNLLPEYCATHKNDDMINVKTKLCEVENCNSIATYGNNNIKQYCNTHKDINMTKLNKDKKCLFESCQVTPSYGYKNKTKQYCKDHKLPTMVLISQSCKFEDCEDRARYNYIDKKGAMYCLKHKKENMVDKNKKICIIENCIKYASFKDDNNKVLYCTEHKTQDTISNKNKKCLFEGCKTAAYYGTREEKKMYCAKHKKDNMCNYVKHNPEYWDKLEKTTRNNEKLKERIVIKYLMRNNIEFNTNTPIDKYKVDILINHESYKIIIEIDEFRHIRHTNDNEMKRMEFIQSKLNSHVVFIRFNPDDFFINKKKYEISINSKLNKLKDLILEYKNCVFDDNIKLKIIYLYYDCKCINEICEFSHIVNY